MQIHELISLGPWDLALASLLLIAPAVASLVLRLGLERDLAIGGARTVAQLGAVGFVLRWIFAIDRWYAVVGLLLVMLTIAAYTAMNRSSKTAPGMFPTSFVSLFVAVFATTGIVTELVLRIEPWYAPRYVIPLAGMLLGSGLTAVSLGLDEILADLVDHRRAIEARLCLGATGWRAVLPWLRNAARTAMIPTINALMIVGIVKLPGMMTGQILAGTEPLLAVAYQILVMFMIAASASVSAIVVCAATVYLLVTPDHRIRLEQITDSD